MAAEVPYVSRILNRRGCPARRARIRRSVLDRLLPGGHHALVAEMAHLRVERAANGYRDRLRSYAVILDGREAGQVKRGQAIEIAVSPGSHVAMLKLDWCSSPSLTFAVSPGEIAILACRPGGSALSAPWHSLFASGRYVAIERVG